LASKEADMDIKKELRKDRVSMTLIARELGRIGLEVGMKPVMFRSTDGDEISAIYLMTDEFREKVYETRAEGEDDEEDENK
jgi:hypothetical protein